ncbi:hypothetical protein ASC61_17880 [Aeromicrobium sp. Root344]|uniref:hypothetical protein n=1 Tax=Aeromicrobium sp. Root344 TaxID=1736521 RepID=UPI0007019F48|nr:hypothetical protein [Aeromicrobium sp. Root344]KQV76719.1 hypothetical protein ASC61_17880 [Aeromicrobium sp. Root344]
MKVRDPQGQTWRVRRRWLPWRRKVRDVPDVPVDGLFTGGDDPVSAILFVIGLVILLPVIVMFAAMLAEFLLLLLLLPLWLFVRALLGGSWPIEVLRGRTYVGTESVKGWTPSGVRMHDIAEEIRLGRPGAGFPLGASPTA